MEAYRTINSVTDSTELMVVAATNYKTGDTKRRTDRMIMNWSSFATERSLTQKIRK